MSGRVRTGDTIGSSLPPKPIGIDDATWRRLWSWAHHFWRIPRSKTLPKMPTSSLVLQAHAIQKVLEQRGLAGPDDAGTWIDTFRVLFDLKFVVHERVQFAVGQGGFHAAAVKACPPRIGFPTYSTVANGDVSWVYDCGSIPKRQVNAAVDRYIELRSKEPIDFLFLSHFDRDHICGTPRLLDKTKGIRAKTVVIPFLDDTERMIFFARACARPDGKRIERFFQQMIVDPVAALQGLNADRIIMIGSDDDDDDGPIGADPTEPPRSGDDRSEGEFPRWKMVPSPRGSGGPLRAWTVGSQATIVRGGSFEMSVDRSAPAWQLVPYVRRADPTRVATFKLAAEVLLGWKYGEFEARMALPATRSEAVSKHREKLARAYKYAFDDKNVTSLSLYSGPANVDDAYGYSDWRGVSHPAKVSWLGTGDADLKDHANVDAFETHFGSVLDYVTTFMLPHHGSIHNSDPSRLVASPDLWVAAAEPVHDWDHPAKQLKRKLGKRLAQVTSSGKTELVERFLIEWKA